MITAEHLRVTPNAAKLVVVCVWCVPQEQLALLNLEYRLTYGMCEACSKAFWAHKVMSGESAA